MVYIEIGMTSAFYAGVVVTLQSLLALLMPSRRFQVSFFTEHKESFVVNGCYGITMKSWRRSRFCIGLSVNVEQVTYEEYDEERMGEAEGK